MCGSRTRSTTSRAGRAATAGHSACPSPFTEHRGLDSNRTGRGLGLGSLPLGVLCGAGQTPPAWAPLTQRFTAFPFLQVPCGSGAMQDRATEARLTWANMTALLAKMAQVCGRVAVPCAPRCSGHGSARRVSLKVQGFPRPSPRWPGLRSSKQPCPASVSAQHMKRGGATSRPLHCPTFRHCWGRRARTEAPVLICRHPNTVCRSSQIPGFARPFATFATL